jgi:peptidoglycan/xylan/chitin deacetylase (PgdA/CDA1 family)
MDIKRPIKSALGRVLRAYGLHKPTFDKSLFITAFHRVNDDLASDPLTCSSADFELFCRYFKDNFKVVPLSEQVSACHNGQPMGGTISITLDDGYLDNYTVAAPILEKLDLPATFFVTTRFIDSTCVPKWDTHLPVHPGWMKWDHVRELVSRGFEIGGHTETHIDLGRESLTVISAELAGSKQTLLQELQQEVRLFAYPFGGPHNITEPARNLVKQAGFDCCLSCYSGTNSPIADPFQLERLPISKWYISPDQMTTELVLQSVH